MKHYYVDLHIHIGRTATNRPVKITGAPSLTIENILQEASRRKGMDMISAVDCHVPEILQELMDLMKTGEMVPLQEGGLRYSSVTFLLGSEIEVYDDNCQGPFHVLAYFPTIEMMMKFSNWLSKRMKNISLSTQRIYESANILQQKVRELDGLFIPAHVFTPFKSLYGSAVNTSLTEVLEPEWIDAIELGLSANTKMADSLQELLPYTFLSNSDAHSAQKIAREYQVVQMKNPNFQELKLALQGKKGRKIVANYGLDPKLGKYHRSTCEKCYALIEKQQECTNCGHKKIIKGVYERVEELKQKKSKKESPKLRSRPPYIHQVPLEFIPKLGVKTLEKLLDRFGTEMNIIHQVSAQELREIVKDEIATKILLGRRGSLSVHSGGGGKYGKVRS